MSILVSIHIAHRWAEPCAKKTVGMDMCGYVCMDMCGDMCMDMCEDMCGDMCGDMCIDMCVMPPWYVLPRAAIGDD